MSLSAANILYFASMFFKKLDFYSCLFSKVFNLIFPCYLSDDLQGKNGKFLRSVHSNNSSSDCFYDIFNILCFFLSLCYPLVPPLLHVRSSLPNFWIWTSSLFSYFHSFPQCPINSHCIFLNPYLSFPTTLTFFTFQRLATFVLWICRLNGFRLIGTGFSHSMYFSGNCPWP